MSHIFILSVNDHCKWENKKLEIILVLLESCFGSRPKILRNFLHLHLDLHCLWINSAFLTWPRLWYTEPKNNNVPTSTARGSENHTICGRTMVQYGDSCIGRGEYYEQIERFIWERPCKECVETSARIHILPLGHCGCIFTLN